jgi:capsular polysaccharide transport system permease protein
LVIDLSEDLVNKMSDRIEEDALQSARDEVEIAAAKVHKASLSVSAFRDNNASLNPAAESSALLRIVSGIETKLIESRAQLGEKMAYMREGSPEIVSLKNRINALSRQLGIEKGRLSSSDEGKGMGDLIEDYQPLMLDQELARQQYASALGSMELARLETLRKKQYLVTFVQPSLPDDAIEPRRFNRILTVMVFSFLVYLLIGLLWSALKDHIGR